MTILGKHPYSFLFAGAGIILLAIIATAQNQSAPAAVGGPQAYVSGGNALIDPRMSGASAPIQNTTSLPESSLSPDSAPSYTVPVQASHPTTPQRQGSATGAATESPPPEGAGLSTDTATAGSDQLLNEMYSLFSLSLGPAMPTVPKARTPDQQALYAYGNAAGAVVLAFEDAQIDAAQVLTDWFSARGDAAKIARANAIADDLTQAGRSLESLPQVPPAALSANTALAKSFEDAGTKLRAVVAAGGEDDTALADAMKTYNAAADSFTGNYIALANIFSIYGVSFGTTDAGSAFSMPQ